MPSCLVCAVKWFGEDERGREKLERDVEEGGEGLLRLSLQETLDLEMRVKVLEVGGNQADGDTGAEAMPGRVIVVHLVSKMSW